MTNKKDVQQVFLDEDFKNRIRALMPIQPELKYWYVPEAYYTKDKAGKFLIPKEQWPMFEIESRNALHLAAIQKDLQTALEDQGKLAVDMIRKHLKGWKNWTIPFDKDRYVKDGVLTDECLQLFKGPFVVELATAIALGNELTEAEILAFV